MGGREGSNYTAQITFQDSAITELMHVIDHKPNNQNETQYYDITFSYGCPVNKLFSIFHDKMFS